MNCRESEDRLSAYLDDVLPAEERRDLEEHLASCPSCARALEDLRETVSLVRDLEEVEPPPWLKGKIMARVREEAAPKRGFLRTLFFPLHVKVPVQAFALVLVAVLAWQVYRTGEPARQVLDLPTPPARVLEQKAAPEAPKAEGIAPAPERMREAPSRAAGRVEAPTVPGSEVPGPRTEVAREPAFAPPPGRSAATRYDGTAAPDATVKADRVARDAAAPPAASAPRVPFPEATGREGVAGVRPGPGAAGKTEREARQGDAAESSAFSPPAEKGRYATAREEKAVAGASRKAAAQPSSGMVLRVRDVAAGTAAAEEALRSAGAWNIRRLSLPGGTLLTADLPENALPGLLDRLRKLGELQAPGNMRDGTRTVRIRIERK